MLTRFRFSCGKDLKKLSMATLSVTSFAVRKSWLWLQPTLRDAKQSVHLVCGVGHSLVGPFVELCCYVDC